MDYSQQKEPLWTKNFIVISGINFLAILIFYLLMVTIAEFAVNEYGVSTSVAGLVSSIFIIGSLIGRFITGRMIVTTGSKRSFYIGLIVFTLTTLSYFISVNLTSLIIIRLLHGIGLGIITTTTGTIIAQLIPSSRRGEGIGYFSLSNILATAVGPFLGILLTNSAGGFRMIFIFNAVLVVLCVLTGLFIHLPEGKKTAESAKSTGFSLSNFIEYKAVPISLVALLIGFAYSGVMSFLSFYSQEINLVTAGSLFFLAYAVVILLSRPVTGPLMDRRGPNIIIYPALILFMVGMTLFSQASSSFIFLLAACLIGLGYGNFHSIAQALCLRGVEKERFGLATSTYFILYDLGLGAGPFILGFVVPHTGYRTLFLLMVPIIFIALVLYMAMVGRKQRQQA